jgi:hypothetical protein
MKKIKNYCIKLFLYKKNLCCIFNNYPIFGFNMNLYMLNIILLLIIEFKKNGLNLFVFSVTLAQSILLHGSKK